MRGHARTQIYNILVWVFASGKIIEIWTVIISNNNYELVRSVAADMQNMLHWEIYSEMVTIKNIHFKNTALNLITNVHKT